MNICLKCTKCTNENMCIWVKTLKIKPLGTQIDNNNKITYCPNFEYDIIFDTTTKQYKEQQKKIRKQQEHITKLQNKLAMYTKQIQETIDKPTQKLIQRKIYYIQKQLLKLLPEDEKAILKKQISKQRYKRRCYGSNNT